MRVILLLVSVLSLSLLAGCEGHAPYFVLSEKTKELIPAARQQVEQQLTDHFGDPLHLIAWEKFPVEYGKSDEGHPGHQKEGWQLLAGRNLYMQHCIHCHGVTGDGNGPTANFLNPRPRDYRLGKFKFTSTHSGLKPNRDDLKQILKLGVPGTSMPSFVLLPETELTALVEYVRWLSIRGEYEYKLASALASLGATESGLAKATREGEGEAKKSRTEIMSELEKSIKENLADFLENTATDLADDWKKADDPENVVIPTVKRVPPTPQSLSIGRELFLSEKTKCADCHGRRGEGNGVQTEQYWPVPNTNPARLYEEPGLHDDWGNLQLPRNLTRGQYRGGRRPLDVFRRIHAGIKGTQMPAFGRTSLTDEQIWHLVNYVMSLPFDGKESAHPAEAPPKSSVVTASH